MIARLRGTFPLLLLLTLATLLAHGRGVANDFAWDDLGLIVGNPDTRDLGRLGEVLLSPDAMPPYYRPLTRGSYLVDHALFGMNPGAFHAVNLGLHLATVLLLFALARRLFQADAPALLAALLLAVHPIHVEAVAFVAARNNLFALAFGLATVLLALEAAERRSWRLAWAAAGTYFLALAGKEQGAMAGPAVGLWFILRPEAADRRWSDLRWLLPLGAALAAYLVPRSIALGGPAALDASGPGVLERLGRNWYVLPAYLKLAVYPDDLSIFHELPDAWASLPWLPFAWVTVAIGVGYLVRRPAPASSFGLMWFAVNLAPIIGLVPIPSTTTTVMAERFIHASAVGLWLVVAELGRRAAAQLPRQVPLATGAAVIIALGLRTSVRTADWHDDLSLFSSAVRTAPRSLIARFNLGTELRDRGDLDGARREWLAALESSPGAPGPLTQLGTLAAVEGRWEEAERRYREALARDPSIAEAWLNLGKLCERSGRTSEAAEHYRRAVDTSGPMTADVGEKARTLLARLATRP